jgi:hypothetical protein
MQSTSTYANQGYYPSAAGVQSMSTGAYYPNNTDMQPSVMSTNTYYPVNTMAGMQPAAVGVYYPQMVGMQPVAGYYPTNNAQPVPTNNVYYGNGGGMQSVAMNNAFYPQ